MPVTCRGDWDLGGSLEIVDYEVTRVSSRAGTGRHSQQSWRKTVSELYEL